ncbi:MAG TPA: transglutaminase-like cysteine peptidase [Azoarcus taiwanensis]|nr:transglutaminase-like cysteine peptidase [Azoarcus taiwanensis]
MKRVLGCTPRLLQRLTLSALVLGVVPTGVANERSACRALEIEVLRMEPAPMQYLDFCNANPGHCASGGEAILEWSEETEMTLARVNREVNAEIEFQPDWDSRGVEDFWCYPADGVGDCEDLALEKRRRLVALGSPRGALTLAIVHHREKFFAHTLLLAETTAGTFLLDNLDDALRCWDAVPYRFERREGSDGRWIRYSPIRQAE